MFSPAKTGYNGLMKLNEETIYRLLRTVPRGKVTTYKALAIACGSRAYRYIGQVMRRNPDAPRTPCHRVVSSTGKIGGFMGKQSGERIARKEELLRREGVTVKDHRIVDFRNICVTSFAKT